MVPPAAVAACLALLLGSQAVASDVQPLHEKVANQVREAIADGEVDRLESLATLEYPDAWLVAWALSARGEHEVAGRFAEHAPPGSRVELLARVAHWKAHPLAPAVAEAWRAAEEAFARGDHETALPLFTSLEADSHPFLDAHRGFRCAWSSRRLGRSDLFPYWQAMREGARACGWLDGWRAAAFEVGDLYRRQSAYEDAVRLWREEIQVETRLGAEVRAARTRVNLGILHAYLGNPRAAADLLEEALQPLASSDDDAFAPALWNLAQLHLRTGSYDVALTVVDRARAYAREREDDAGRARCELFAQEIHFHLGHPERSLEHGALALAAYEALEDPEGIAQALGNRALTYERIGRLGEAVEEMQGTRARFVEIDDPGRVAYAEVGLGRLSRKLGRLARAEAYCRHAVATGRTRRDRELEAVALQELGQVLHLRDGKDASIAALREGLTIAVDDGLASVEVEIRETLAEVLLDLGRTSEAIAEARAGVEVLGTVFNGLADQEAARARESRAGLFEAGMRAASIRDDPEAFLHFLEGGRAGALLESLSSRDAIRDAAVSPDLLADLDAAHANLGIARKKLDEARSQGVLPPIREATAGVEAAKKAYTDVHDRFQREVKAAAGLLFFPEPAKGAEIRRALRPTDVLVEYALLTDDVYALVLTAKKQRIVPLGSRAELEALIEGAQWNDEDLEAPAAAGLRALLVEPLDLLPSATRVLVAPDGVLFRVPLALLFEQDELWHVASATTWLHQSREKRRRGVGVLAVGDPYYAGRLSRLEKSGDEARAIGTKVLLGSEATEAALREALGAQDTWRAIHLACHGTVDPQHPLHSALELTATEDDDGRLTVGEMFDLPFEADLVALSACSSGAGGYYRGEGLIGLTRAITLAGAPRVLCSLWAVDDAATRRLMEKFYELWGPGGTPGKGGISAAAALRQAQAWMRSQSKWAHPCYWAAWTLWGVPD